MLCMSSANEGSAMASLMRASNARHGGLVFRPLMKSNTFTVQSSAESLEKAQDNRKAAGAVLSLCWCWRQLAACDEPSWLDLLYTGAQLGGKHSLMGFFSWSLQSACCAIRFCCLQCSSADGCHASLAQPPEAFQEAVLQMVL